MTEKKRFAPQRDRDVAALIATGLRNRLGPDDEAPPDAVVWTIDSVLVMLDHFAKYGTFDFDASKRTTSREYRDLAIPMVYRMMREDDGETYEEAVRKLSKQFRYSEGTVKRLVPAGYSKKGPPVLK